jgi:hypothetical protein
MSIQSKDVLKISAMQVWTLNIAGIRQPDTDLVLAQAQMPKDGSIGLSAFGNGI